MCLQYSSLEPLRSGTLKCKLVSPHNSCIDPYVQHIDLPPDKLPKAYNLTLGKSLLLPQPTLQLFDGFNWNIHTIQLLFWMDTLTFTGMFSL